MQIDVIELARFNGSGNHAGHSVRGKADETDTAFFLELTSDLQAAAATQREVEDLFIIDAMKAQQVNVIELQILHRLVERGQEFLRIGARADLGLDHHPLARQPRENFAKLQFGRPVTPRGFNVVDAELQRPVDRGFEVCLALGGDAARVLVFPRVLIAHPPARNDGHGKIGSAKTTVFHRCIHFIPLARPD